MKPTMNNEESNKLRDLEQQIADLQFRFNKGNSGSMHDFNKAIKVDFIRMKEYASAPAVANEGELYYIDGKLRICTVGGSSPTFTVVGTQS